MTQAMEEVIETSYVAARAGAAARAGGTARARSASGAVTHVEYGLVSGFFGLGKISLFWKVSED
jgi:hypothetical protein